MKTMMISAASAAAFAILLGISAPVSAQADAPKPAADKCEWQSSPQIGPRTPLKAPICRKAGNQREALTGIGGPNCDPSYTGKTGRYVWRMRPQHGPRAPLQAPVREWVDVEAC